MRATVFFALSMVCLYHTAIAQVPESGRWQNLDFTADAVKSRTADQIAT